MKKSFFFLSALISALCILFIAGISFAQSDFGSETKQNVQSYAGFHQENPYSNLESKPLIPQELDAALKQALIDNNQSEIDRINAEINKVSGDAIRKQQILTFDKDYAKYNLNPGAPFVADWMPNDVLVSRDSLSPYALFPIRLKYGEDGNMYMALNKSGVAGRFGLIEIWRSNNGGLNWSLVNSVSAGAAYFGDFDMLVENKGGTILDSTRIILFYSRSLSTNQVFASLRWFSVRRDGTAPLGGTDIATPSITPRKLTYVSAVSDGIYYGSTTYIGVVFAELSNVNDSSKSLRMLRSTDWGTTWVGATYSTVFAAAGFYYTDYPYSASIKPGVTFATDSVFICVQRSVSGGSTDIKIIKATFNPNNSFTVANITTAAAGVNYTQPIIAIQQNDRAVQKNIIITSLKSGTGVYAMGGNIRARYHQSQNSGVTWTTDLLLDNRGSVGSNNIISTYITADSSSAGNFEAIFTTPDSINVRRGILGNLGTTTYKRNSRTALGYTAVCAMYKSGVVKYSAFAYATPIIFGGPDSTFYNQENLPTWIGNQSTLADSYSLLQNYPNPFNPATKINFSIPKNEFVRIVVYDLSGKEVATLLSEEKNAGKYEIEFNANNLSSGIYFYKLTTKEYVETKKMMLIK